ncbi:hypothetical protein HMPREF9080_01323 [Cardiobacterium valvarum F0432]|uniref:Uncharacterized protein n=1 Tax=Cardiobacterium valvarum F0432 TaxID=797473 RepID=G9ZEY3_9GAMM|nr:hypothetical protein HMPREF9080_01323 [Cardiobacterium valvarum F0432]
MHQAASILGSPSGVDTGLVTATKVANIKSAGGDPGTFWARQCLTWFA